MQSFRWLMLLLFALPSAGAERWERPIPLVRFNYETRRFDRGKLTREGAYAVTFRAEFSGEPPHTFTEPMASQIQEFWASGTHPLDHFWYMNQDPESAIVIEPRPGDNARRTQFSEIEIAFRESVTLTPRFVDPEYPGHVYMTTFPLNIVYGATGGESYFPRLAQLVNAIRIVCARFVAIH